MADPSLDDDPVTGALEQDGDEQRPTRAAQATETALAASAAGLTRALALGRRASVAGVGTAGSAWSRRAPMEWHGPPPGHHRSLVIVGGYAGTSSMFGRLQRSLEAAGWNHVVLMPPVDNAFADIRESADRLASMVHLLGGEVDLLAHSEGGLISRWYLAQLGGTERVRRLVTVGTPHRGLPSTIEDLPVPARVTGTATRLIDRVRASERTQAAVEAALEAAREHLVPTTSVAFRQMLRGSELMQTLDADPTPGPTEYLSIASRRDGIIPLWSSLLDEGDNVANVVLRAGWARGNHASIVTDNLESFHAMVTFLRRA